MDAHETSIYIAILISSLILGIVILYFALSIIRQQRNNLELYKRAIHAEITTLEQARTRIANDLHDELGPMLSVLKFYIDNPSPDIKQQAEQAQLTSESINEIIDRLRMISGNLTPTVLIRKGLIAAVQDFVEKTSQAAGIPIYFRHSISIDLTQEANINLYRIFQESVHNAIKHAKCREIILQIKEEGDNLLLVCRDDGIGFDQQRVLQYRDGLGLLSLKSRTDILEGKMQIKSKPGEGTFLLFIIPLNKRN